MKKIKTFAAVLGLFAGGVVIGQAFPYDADQLKRVPVANTVPIADELYEDYTQTVKQAKSAAQASQTADEMLVRFEYLQIKQNAEIIRLLTDIKNKK